MYTAMYSKTIGRSIFELRISRMSAYCKCAHTKNIDFKRSSNRPIHMMFSLILLTLAFLLFNRYTLLEYNGDLKIKLVMSLQMFKSCTDHYCRCHLAPQLIEKAKFITMSYRGPETSELNRFKLFQSCTYTSVSFKSYHAARLFLDRFCGDGVIGGCVFLFVAFAFPPLVRFHFFNSSGNLNCDFKRLTNPHPMISLSEHLCSCKQV